MIPVWVQLHTSHQPDSPEVLLHKAGKRFIGGRHQLRNATHMAFMRQWGLWERGKLSDKPSPPAIPDGEKNRRVYAQDIVVVEKETPEGAFMCFSKENYQLIRTALARVLQYDSAVWLMIVIREGHRPFKPLLEWLQSVHRRRHVSVRIKKSVHWFNWDERDDAAWPAEDMWTWKHADLRYGATDLKALTLENHPGVWEMWEEGLGVPLANDYTENACNTLAKMATIKADCEAFLRNIKGDSLE